LVWNPIVENWSGRESSLEEFEGSFLLVAKNEWNMLLGESGGWNNNVRKVVNEMAVKFSKTKKGLNVFNLPRVRPVVDHFNLCQIHK